MTVGAALTPAAGAPPANDNVDYDALPDLGARGKPLATIENLAEVLNRLGVTVRYNMIGKSQEILIPGESFLVDNQSGASFARLESQCARFGMPTEKLGGFLLYLADKNPFNPVMQWIAGKPWDGTSRFPDLLATVRTRPGFDREIWGTLLRRWLISAVAAVAKPAGFWSKGVLVFQGAQSLGKTAWFRSLLPEELRQLVKVDATIDPNNKDSIISAVSHWLVELGELDGTLRKADIARLKGFISQDIDQFRRPYARAEEKFQRRTVFFASVNPEQFLADDTGNVRWWTIPAVGVNYSHGIDMQQLWAEVLHWYDAGESWWLEPHEEARLEAINSHHQSAHPVDELIQARYGAASENGPRFPMTATQVLLAIGYDKPTKDQLNTAAFALRKLCGDPRKTKAGRFFDVPAMLDDRPF
jgi:putative DNA primase/helicase